MIMSWLMGVVSLAVLIVVPALLVVVEVVTSMVWLFISVHRVVFKEGCLMEVGV